MRKYGKALFVCLLAFLVATPPAMACRFRLLRRCCRCYTVCDPCGSSGGGTTVVSSDPDTLHPVMEEKHELPPAPKAPVAVPTPAPSTPSVITPPAAAPMPQAPPVTAANPPEAVPSPVAPQIPAAPAKGADDDLFGAGTGDAVPTEVPAEKDVPGTMEPPAGETPVEPTTPDAVDELFSDPAADKGPQAETAPAQDAPVANDADDLFGNPQADATPAEPQFQADVERTWTDDTGSFQVEAKMVQVLDGKVRLLKDNGRYTTVSLKRLSNSDRDFVEKYGSLLVASAHK